MIEIIHSLSYTHHEIRSPLKSLYFHIWLWNSLLLWNPNVQYSSLLGYDTLQLPKSLPVWNNLLPPSLEYKSCWECYIHHCHHTVLWPRRPKSMFSLSLGPLMVNNTELQRPSVHNFHAISWKYVTQIKRCCSGRHTYSERYDNAMFQACNFLWNVDIA